MNKANPNDIVADFEASTNDARDDWKTIDAALADAGHGIQLRRRAASDAFLSLAVTWEGFLSSWLVAAVNRDPAVAVQMLENKLKEHATEELRIPAASLAATLVTTGHLSVAEVGKILDPQGYNIVMRTRADLSSFAKRWLAGDYRVAAEGITAFQFRVAEVTRLVRNALAHRSRSALKAANDLIALNATPVAFRWSGARRLDVRGFGRYLLSTTNPPPRVVQFHDELVVLANRLRVS